MSWRVVRAAAVVQWHTSVRAPEHLLILLVSPLFSVIFLTIVDHAGRRDLIPSIVIGTGLIGIWFVAVNVAGGVILNERYMSTLELVLAAPRALALVVCGRILPVIVIGALSLAESSLIARLAFSAPMTIRHPWLVLVTLTVTIFASAATATALAAIFILTRNVPFLENVLTYPFYILGGVLFPTTVLPDWVQSLARLFFLSWSSDLLRDGAMSDMVSNAGGRLAVIVGLGLAALALGMVIIRYTIARARRTGTVSLA